jgi:2-methylcitrate dehydratase PrpD
MSTGPLVDEIAEFAVSADLSVMSGSARAAMRRNILDSLSCAAGALDGEALRMIRGQIEADGGNPACTLIGGGRANAAQSTLFNSVLVRYIDQLDTYLTAGGLCHPADNFGAVLAVAEQTQASGEDFLLALAVAYEIQSRFSAAVPVMARGLNHALQLAMSVAAAASKLMGLDVERASNAIAAATADNVSLAALHCEPVSNWKGLSPGITAQRAVSVTDLAARGITGPKALFEGPNGLFKLFGQAIDLDLSRRDLNVAEQTYLKKYCSLIHGQALIDTTLALAAQEQIRHDDIERVEVDMFDNGYQFAGGGSYGNKDHPQTKEQGDYNLKYLTAVALIDGQVGPEQLQTERIRRADVQDLLSRVEIRPDAELSRGYPGTTPVRVHIHLRGGRHVTREQTDYEGAPTRPLTWDRVVRKFHWLAEPHADAKLRDAIIDAVDTLEQRSIAGVTTLLGEMSTPAQRPRTNSPL